MIMRRVIISVTVPSYALPAFVIIRNYRGDVLYYGALNQRYRTYIVTTNETGLIFTVRPINSAYRESSRYINLCSVRCLRLNYNFTFYSPPAAIQSFTLTDKNYGFPIDSATLYFTAVN